MGIFGVIKNWIVNKRNVSNRFNPYFNNCNHDLNRLKVVIEEIDPEITKIYNQIKQTAPQKYVKEISLYESHISRIKDHNRKVNKINEGMRGLTSTKS